MGAPKVSRRSPSTSILGPTRLIIATLMSLFALWLFWDQQSEFVSDLWQWFSAIAEGKKRDGFPEAKDLYQTLTQTVALALAAGLISPMALWRWVGRYLNGVTISILIAGLLTSYDFEGGQLTESVAPFLTLMFVFGLGVLKRSLFGRAFFISDSVVERITYPLLNWSILVLALLNLLALVGMIVVTQYREIFQKVLPF